jgi:phospholipid-binding lipoprotein MlaA
MTARRRKEEPSRALPLLALLAALLPACAGPSSPSAPAAPDGAPEESEQHRTDDPAEPLNRRLYAFNDWVDARVVKPAVRVYHDYVPDSVRAGVHNFLTNLSQPSVFVDQVLSGNPRRAGDVLMRFLTNTTLGVGGLFDPATALGYASHPTSLDIVLGVWGVPSGPYAFLPFLGPTDPRAAATFIGGLPLDPLIWVASGTTETTLAFSRYVFSAGDQREHADYDLDRIKATSLDPYATLRSLYRQHEASMVERERRDDPATLPAWFTPPPADALPPATRTPPAAH